MEIIREQAEELKEYLVGIRRELHRHPELSLQEFRTAKRIERELDWLGIGHRRVGETGVCAVLKGKADGGGVVALRADIDALPIEEASDVEYRSENRGVMHACGHDAHTACLLGAARILAGRKAEFSGEVRFFFQQAEEVGGGGRLFAGDGSMDGVERVFGLHTAPDLPVGTVGVKSGVNNASVDHFVITVTGKSSHVCAPHLGVDALYIASQIVVALQAVVTRRTSPVEPVVIGVGKLTAGTAYNAVAASAVLEGTTRNISPENRSRVNRLVEETARGIAQIYGGSVSVEWEDFTAPLINDAQVCREAVTVIDGIFGEGTAFTGRELYLSGDDFAELLKRAPGVYVYLGTGNSELPETLNPYHSDRYAIDESAMTIGAGIYAGYALWWLKEGRLRK